MAECILLLARKEAVAEQTVAGEVVGEVEGVDPVYKAAEGLADELEATQAFSGGGGLEEEEDPPTQAFSGGRGEAEMEDTPTQAYSGGGGEAVGEVEEVEEQVVNTLTQAFTRELEPEMEGSSQTGSSHRLPVSPAAPGSAKPAPETPAPAPSLTRLQPAYKLNKVQKVG